MFRYWKIGLLAALATTFVAFPATASGHDDPGGKHAASELVVVNAKKARSTLLTIPHVQEGCHLFATGKTRAANMKLLVARGARVTIANRDIDGHRFVQRSGPKIKAPRLAMNQKATFVFKKTGVYKLTTRSFEMPGMPEMSTEGADNVLLLTIAVR